MKTGPNNAEWALPMPDWLTVEDAHIYLVGFGLRVPHDFTLEAIAALKRSTRVFAAPALDDSLGFPPMIDLTKLYARNKARLDTYREMTDAVLDAATESPPVSFLTYGSAIVGTRPSHMILDEAPKRGLTVRVCHGVSSLEGIWADLNIEPFHGFLIWEASRFVADRIEPPTAAHLLLVQAPAFNIRTGPRPGEPMGLADLEPLRDYLLRFYPANHRVSFIRTAWLDEPTHVQSVPLRKLGSGRIDTGSSLLIPSLSPARVW